MLKPLALAAALVAAPAFASVPAPTAGIASFDQLAKPLPLPYNEHGADDDARVAAAAKRARAAGKLLLVDLGGNWCPDCRILAGTMDVPAIKRFVAAHYELVMVDIGRLDKNLQIPKRYGMGKPEGVPALLVVDPRTNKLLNAGRVSALSDARHMTPQALADWLAQWPRK